MDNFRFYSGKTLSYAEIYQLYTSQTYNLDVSGGILANGASVIYEAVGTVATSGENVGRKGTLTLLHGDASGASSIVFPSVNNGTSDYAYIQYQENVPYAGLPDTEAGLLTIGVENDASNGFIDRICLLACGGIGRVGINNKFPGYNLDVSGTVNATSYNATSDYRVKADVTALDASFNVDVLKPVTYMNTRHGRKDVGFIAHEVQEHYPFLVNGEKDGEHMQSLNYIGLIGILTKEIQDLKRRLAEMEVRFEKSVIAVEYNVRSVDDHVRSVEDHVRSVEDHVLNVETTVRSVETTVLSEQARLVICETDIALNKSAIKDIGDRFQS
jgi:hypothetical protein